MCWCYLSDDQQFIDPLLEVLPVCKGDQSQLVPKQLRVTGSDALRNDGCAPKIDAAHALIFILTIYTKAFLLSIGACNSEIFSSLSTFLVFPIVSLLFDEHFVAGVIVGSSCVGDTWNLHCSRWNHHSNLWNLLSSQ